jgi:pantoate--beta-alanine ligase
MHLIRTARELEAMLGRAAGGCALAPTMGALHAGHGTLIRRGVELARERGLTGGCVVTVFVNPTQFNDPKDFDRYPRTLDADAALCERAGASVVFAPGPEEVYPPGLAVAPPPLPAVATRPGLEDSHRPGHFAGVCRVVKRLFELVRPALAVFGEKDWQQLQVVRAMTASVGLPVSIVGVPTVRERDGLAMSSRNIFLTPEDRPRALAVSRALCDACAAPGPREGEAVMVRTLARAGIEPEYAVVRDAATLEPAPPGFPGPWRALIAARLGGVRLIDNAPWRPAPAFRA